MASDSDSTASLIARVEAAGRAAGFRVEEYGAAGGLRLLALTKRAPGPRPRIYVSGGIHGDEPATTLAILDLIAAGIFDHRAVWFVCPLLNPLGLAARTRENQSGIDLNRDYREPRSGEVRAHIAWMRRQPNFSASLALHEDWEATGFYLYEQNPRGRPSLAGPIIAAVAAVCPIDLSALIDGREANLGIIRPSGDPAQRDLWPESIYLRVHHTSLAYTLETPSGFPLPQRVKALRAAVTAAIDRLIGPE